ncbi:MAG: TIGR00282 family metallophosphoesterase [Candidatus Caenarcaniphilales bacterium]|nr:TIGR00282 family metallophosphoesterase [Candidatus Caenarcaniphilales bacterium]
MDLIFLGDIIGNQAIHSAIDFIQNNQEANQSSFRIANVENASGGFGLTEEHYQQLTRGGFDILSGGNHIWDKKEIFHYIGKSKIARPYNLPQGTPGAGWQIVEKEGVKIGLINLLGRVFMSVSALDCPFRSCDRAIEELRAQGVRAIFVDIHAEASSEKQALGYYLDGRVTAVIGTHTHVQTADERLLPKGTAFITDAGPCAAYDSVIGMSPESILPKFLTGLPGRAEASKKPVRVHGVKVRFDQASGLAHGISRLASS